MNNPVDFEIKLREFDAINKRLVGVRTLVRAAYSEKEARNKVTIAHDRCVILSIKLKEAA